MADDEAVTQLILLIFTGPLKCQGLDIMLWVYRGSGLLEQVW